jgi:hypothetical protein
VHVFNFRDPRIGESSGISSANEDPVMFTHNDSGDSGRFFAVGAQGQTLRVFNVLGALAVDWEDMARGPGEDGSSLYFGDIGDNFVFRPFVTVYEVAEPAVDPTSPGDETTALVASVKTLFYEDGPHDAETLFVDPKSGAIGIVTKRSDGRSGVYIAPRVSGSATATLRRVADIDFTSIARSARDTDFDPTSRLQSRGGDISPDGQRFVVRTYVEAFEWDVSGGLAAGLERAPLRIPLPRTTQGEAIAYSNDGRSLMTSTEQLPAAVHRLTLQPTSSSACS